MLIDQHLQAFDQFRLNLHGWVKAGDHRQIQRDGPAGRFTGAFTVFIDDSYRANDNAD
jgi:hypothetical protein